MDFSCIQSGKDTGENRPMTERETRLRNYYAGSGKTLELVRGFKEGSKSMICI